MILSLLYENTMKDYLTVLVAAADSDCVACDWDVDGRVSR